MDLDQIDAPSSPVLHAAIAAAARRCRPWLFETPLEYSYALSELCGGEVWLKLDLVQRTTSFKLRGATNKVRSLPEEAIARGVITASTGNYALAIAEALRPLNGQATTYVGENITPSRLALMEAHGLQVVPYGKEAGAAEARARAVALEQGREYVSPYNDLEVVAGQGTCGVEIARQLPAIDTAVIAVGGGGLIAGCGEWLKGHNPQLELVGVSPAASPVMHDSMAAGRVMNPPIHATLADTCAGGIDQDTMTLPLCARLIDRFELLSEAQIEQGIRYLFEHHRLVAEGSAAMGVALLLAEPERFRDRCTALVVCGRNIDLGTFRRIIG